MVGLEFWGVYFREFGFCVEGLGEVFEGFKRGGVCWYFYDEIFVLE